MRTPIRNVFAAFFLSSVGLAAEPDAVIQQIRSTRLDPSRASEVKGLKLDVGGGGSLTIRSGVIVPASPIGSAPIEMVFIGDATIEITAPDDIEAGQLELFTGSGKLSEDFEEAIFVVANDAAVAGLLKRPRPDLAADKLSRAVDLFQKWLLGPERKQLSIESVLFADGVDDPFHRGFFSAVVNGQELGRFLYIYHPDSEEEITLGQFVPLPLEKRDERRIRKQLERQQRRGRLIGLRVEDLGQWDTWISASIRNEQGEEVSSAAGFEPQRYVLEIDIADRSLRLGGKARLDLTVKSGLRKLVKLQLHSDLAVNRVTAGGTATPFFRSGSDLYVHLSSVPAVNESLPITVEYSGDLLEKVTRKTTALRDTSLWYPRIGELDRARYDVTFRWPRDLGLVSAGKRVDGGTAGGRPWERRILDTPSSAFSFEVGRFVKDTFQAGHVAVTLAYDAEGRSLDMSIRDEIHKTVHDSLLYFEEIYGRYPLDELIVVTVPRDFSQSHLGFVTLSNVMMADFDVFASFFGIEDRRTIIAHEIAHQWWGHLVGWVSYRDQWFTEALASYSALQFSRKKLVGSDLTRRGPTSGWQAEILDTTEDGRTIESLGPLTLGERLISSRSEDAYVALIYKKGAIVIDMLARIYGEENFDRILRSIVKSARDLQITTKDLLRIVQAAAKDVDVQGFANQFIFGTGVPVIRYDYEFLPKGNSTWEVKGVATQYISVRYRYRILFRDSRYDVVRETIPETKVSEWTMVVPFQVGITRSADRPARDRSLRQLEREIGNAFLFGRLQITGKKTPFAFDVDYEPKTLWLDRDKETLARFFSPQTSPKRVLLSEAAMLAAEGRFREAEEKYREVVRAPKTTEYDPEVQKLGDTLRRLVLESSDATLDAHAHLGIAQIRMEQKQYSAVAAALQDARKSARSGYRVVDGDIGILEGRLHIEQGDYKSGFTRLRKLMLGRSPASSDAEGYAWLAIAAKLTQHPKELEKALEAAKRKGVDTTALN